VSAGRKRPTGPPPSAGVLARYAQAYARELGVAEGRVRAWVAYMILAGVLDRATTADSPLFIVKGGVALELRLRDRARATKDIDIVLRDTTADLAGSLEDALTGEPYQGFSFRRKGEPLLLDNGAVNIEFGATYNGQPWTSVSVDIVRAEPGEADVEWVDAIALTDAPRRKRASPIAVPAASLPRRAEAARHDPSAAAGQAERTVPGPGGPAPHGRDDHSRLRRPARGLRAGLPQPKHPLVATRPLDRAGALGAAVLPSRRGAQANRN